jgi:hypothetical protein
MKLTFTSILILLCTSVLLYAQVDFTLNQWGRIRFYDPNGSRQIDRVSFDFAVDSANVYMYQDVGITLPFSPPTQITATIADSEVVSTICYFDGVDTIAYLDHHIYRWYDQNFLLVKFSLYNNTSSVISNYLSSEVMPYVDGAPGDETVDYDTANDIGYSFKTSSYAGVKLLSTTTYSFRAMQYSDYSQGGTYPDSVQWINIIDPNNSTFPFLPGSDGSACFLNAGAFNLSTSDTIDFFMAVAYGTTLSELQTEIMDAENIYNQFFTSISNINPVPPTFYLGDNYPNPFNPTTTIPISLDNTSEIALEIFNVLGQKVATLFEGTKATGLHHFNWDGTNALGVPMESGIYFYRLQINDQNGNRYMTKKMILAK